MSVMEKFGERESVLPGSYPRTSFRSSPKLPHSAPEMDFNDVFGGPPRRFSNQEVSIRYSASETVDSEEGGSSFPGGSRWSGFDEKPVFGEEVINRRQLSSNDFYDDIFRGDDSKSYSSPRSSSFDLFGSNPGPGLRVLSPSRPLPSDAEPFSPSFPVQSSLPAKLANATDFPVLGSSNRSMFKSKEGVSSGMNSPYASTASLTRFSGQANDMLDDNRTESSRNCETSLSCEVSLKSAEELSYLAGSFGEEKPRSQFHFSIYRWAGNGIPMLTPLIGSHRWRSTGKRKMERCSTSNGRMEKELVDMKMEKMKEYIISVDSESDSLIVNIEEPEESSNVVKTKSHDIPKSESIQTAGDAIPHKQSAKERGIAVEGEGITSAKTNAANRTADIRSRHENSKGIHPGGSYVNDISSKRPATNQGDASVKLRAEGKVKEFVKIFNQDTSAKTKMTSDPQSHSSRWKGLDIKGKENKTRNVAETEVNVHPKDGDNFNTVKGEQDLRSKNSNETNSSDPFPEVKVESTEEFFEGHFQVEEISPIVEKDSQCTGDSVDMKALDAKIQQWSSGRKGNIRSLLSTLQYVLWPESGWKPMPLVDIIEANAVNRAYRKAMLYLHPDKLQQKGATSYQKHTAEKVFEILQEAWDHYNSLGAI